MVDKKIFTNEVIMKVWNDCLPRMNYWLIVEFMGIMGFLFWDWNWKDILDIFPELKSMEDYPKFIKNNIIT